MLADLAEVWEGHGKAALEHLAKNEPTKLALIARCCLPTKQNDPELGGSGPLLPTDLLEGQRLEGIGRLAESNTARFVAQPVSAPDGLWHGASRVRASIRTHQPRCEDRAANCVGRCANFTGGAGDFRGQQNKCMVSCDRQVIRCLIRTTQ